MRERLRDGGGDHADQVGVPTAEKLIPLLIVLM
jgi:hypothetical protein